MFSNPNYMSGHIPSSTAPVFTEQQQHRLIMGPPRLRKYQSIFDSQMEINPPIALSTAAVHRAAA